MVFENIFDNKVTIYNSYLSTKKCKELGLLGFISKWHFVTSDKPAAFVCDPTLEELLDYLYSEEINIEITSFWDDGYTARLGSSMGGFGPTNRSRTAIEAVADCVIDYMKHKQIGKLPSYFQPPSKPEVKK